MAIATILNFGNSITPDMMDIAATHLVGEYNQAEMST